MNDLKFYQYLRRKNFEECINQNLLLGLIVGFKRKLGVTNSISPKHNNAIFLFSKTINNIHSLKPIKTIFRATDSESFYFRFYTELNKVIHLEVFYVKENDDDNIEAVTTIYENNIVLLKEYGLFENVFEKIREAIFTDIGNTYETNWNEKAINFGSYMKLTPQWDCNYHSRMYHKPHTISTFVKSKKESTFAEIPYALSC